ncbi:c-type cytochrome [Azospira restricta]|uniref:Cytochrome c4 n=1 Tax=Azospira restricta TaxID=404405 RepID=A0A974SPA3_9RHOO|nr:c-type cytochrome [Azospira restricta]QRJ63924.1 cytochrome c4 [Azospira restricta]
MIRPTLTLLALLLSAAAAAQPGALDRLRALQANPAASKAAAEQGRQAAFFCVNCHGEDGNSQIPEVPSLAGQNPAYLIEQMRKFGAGERRDPFMQGLIKVLKDEERAQIALYYAAGRPQANKANATLAAQGRSRFEKSCATCHGPRGRGNDAELIPRIAGQKPAYLESSITRYRNRSGERNDPRMTAVTANLAKDEIVALANYLASLD